VRTAGPQRRVFLVTIKVPRTYENANNRMLRKCASGFGPERVRIVDWNWAATKNLQWLYADGIHLRPEGARAFARIMRNAINSASASKQFAG
jgi:lysophospholipase L1-like esterase